MYKLLCAIFILLVSLPTLSDEKPVTVYVKIKKAILPLDRTEKFEEPLNAALKKKKYGEVMGGGTMMNKYGSIEYVGIDLDLTNLIDGLPFLKSKLIELGIPEGTTLEYQFFNNQIVEKVN